MSVQLLPMILEGLSVLSVDAVDKETLFSLLLVLSGTLTDTKGKKNLDAGMVKKLLAVYETPFLSVCRKTISQ